MENSGRLPSGEAVMLLMTRNGCSELAEMRVFEQARYTYLRHLPVADT